ncbi:HAD-like domain-containing protein [Paraphysoderma sedebokerense]|nr:HAD-like domain-containing protein [Paraphysoderma sedebokerense]
MLPQQLISTLIKTIPAKRLIPFARFKSTGTVKIPAFAFDIDGVLIQGGNVLPQAKRALKMVKGDNKLKRVLPHVFLTNGGGVTEKAKAAELSDKFDMHITENDLVLAHTPLKSLAKKYQDDYILVVGGDGTNIQQVAYSYGFKKVVTPYQIVKWNNTIWPFVRVPEERLSIESSPPDFSKTPIRAVMVFHDSRDWGTDLQVVIDVLRSPDGCLGKSKAKSYFSPSLYARQTFRTSLPTLSHHSPSSPSTMRETADHVRAPSMAIKSEEPQLFEKQQIPIYFSNPDFIWANEFPLPRFAAGAFKDCLEVLWNKLTGNPLTVSITFGKPTRFTYSYADQILIDQASRLYPTSEVDMNVYGIGDNPAADIKGANDYGWNSILVKTGVYSGGKPQHTPSVLVNDVEEGVVWALKREGLL